MTNEASALVKWPGGKSSEADILLSLVPEFSGRFIDPFVGGGAMYFLLGENRARINDLSAELIALYRLVQKGDKIFFGAIKKFNFRRENLIGLLQHENRNILHSLIDLYGRKELDREEIVNVVDDWLISVQEELKEFSFNGKELGFLAREIKLNIARKVLRVRQLESEQVASLEMDLTVNIETALHSAFYMYVRHLYNRAKELRLKEAERIATFYYLREFCYSSMFRFNKQGKFNVPYGGMAYNTKDFGRKIANLSSLQNRLSRTQIYNLDFEKFLRKARPSPKDFVFLDPPYDTEFSNYDGNEFGREDHRRLAKFLSRTEASFLLVIKNTPFVRGLYGSLDGVQINIFDKQYTVSFQNRNEQKVKHLVFTNYKVSYATP